MGMGGVGYMLGGIHVGRIREVRVGTLGESGRYMLGRSGRYMLGGLGRAGVHVGRVRLKGHGLYSIFKYIYLDQAVLLLTILNLLDGFPRSTPDVNPKQLTSQILLETLRDVNML